MGCTPAPACKAAREQATRLAPRRSQASDGICGDEAHQKRVSDHNEGNAVDLTHDPVNGFDAHAHVEAIKQRRDPRVKYIISNRRIWNPGISDAWRAYNGSNPHTQHAHISIYATARDDTSPWFETVQIASTEEDEMTEAQDKVLRDAYNHATQARDTAERVEGKVDRLLAALDDPGEDLIHEVNRLRLGVRTLLERSGGNVENGP